MLNDNHTNMYHTSDTQMSERLRKGVCPQAAVFALALNSMKYISRKHWHDACQDAINNIYILPCSLRWLYNQQHIKIQKGNHIEFQKSIKKQFCDLLLSDFLSRLSHETISKANANTTVWLIPFIFTSFQSKIKTCDVHSKGTQKC